MHITPYIHSGSHASLGSSEKGAGSCRWLQVFNSNYIHHFYFRNLFTCSATFIIAQPFLFDFSKFTSSSDKEMELRLYFFTARLQRHDTIGFRDVNHKSLHARMHRKEGNETPLFKNPAKNPIFQSSKIIIKKAYVYKKKENIDARLPRRIA